MQRYSGIIQEWKAFDEANKPRTPPRWSGTRLERAISQPSYSREFIAVRRLPTRWKRLEPSRGLGSRREEKFRNRMTVQSKRAWNKALMDRNRMRMAHMSRKVLEGFGVTNGMESVEVEGSGVGGESSNIVSVARGVALRKYGPNFGLSSSSSSSSCKGFFMIDIYRLVHNCAEVKGLLPHVNIIARVESFGRDNVILALLTRLGSGLVCASTEDLASIRSSNNNNNSGTVEWWEVHDQHCCRPELHLKELSKCMMINSIGGKRKSSSEHNIQTVSVDSCDEGARMYLRFCAIIAFVCSVMFFSRIYKVHLSILLTFSRSSNNPNLKLSISYSEAAKQGPCGRSPKCNGETIYPLSSLFSEGGRGAMARTARSAVGRGRRWAS